MQGRNLGEIFKMHWFVNILRYAVSRAKLRRGIWFIRTKFCRWKVTRLNLGQGCHLEVPMEITEGLHCNYRVMAWQCLILNIKQYAVIYVPANYRNVSIFRYVLGYFTQKLRWHGPSLGLSTRCRFCLRTILHTVHTTVQHRSPFWYHYVHKSYSIMFKSFNPVLFKNLFWCWSRNFIFLVTTAPDRLPY